MLYSHIRIELRPPCMQSLLLFLLAEKKHVFDGPDFDGPGFDASPNEAMAYSGYSVLYVSLSDRLDPSSTLYMYTTADQSCEERAFAVDVSINNRHVGN